jgi:hypothetical protein
MWWCAARGSSLFHALGLAASLIKSGHISVNKIYVHGAWPHYPATQLAGAYPSGRIPILLYAVEKDGWGLGTGRKRHAEKKKDAKTRVGRETRAVFYVPPHQISRGEGRVGQHRISPSRTARRQVEIRGVDARDCPATPALVPLCFSFPWWRMMPVAGGAGGVDRAARGVGGDRDVAARGAYRVQVVIIPPLPLDVSTCRCVNNAAWRAGLAGPYLTFGIRRRWWEKRLSLLGWALPLLANVSTTGRYSTSPRLHLWIWIVITPSILN